jgi:hypothetical protein
MKKHVTKIKIISRFLLIPVVVALYFSCSQNYESYITKGRNVIDEIPLGLVWSAHPVDFDILTTDKFQYVAYYDTSRTMCIAQRRIDNKDWEITHLPSVTGWDTHNYIDIIRDKDGYIHISGNMHNVPLIYFRSNALDNINEFNQLSMIGRDEDRSTYPVFFNDPEGNLFFQHRNGSSGNGIYYWNKYDENTKAWIRMNEKGIFDGEDEVGAYPCQLTTGPDGYFHIVWTWRLNGNANTNHNLSHMRSKDLVNWETIKGKQLSLPVTYSNFDVIIDPIGPWNGLINGDFYPSWDNQNRLCITYHRYDREGISQILAIRWESDRWKLYQVSKWSDFIWNINKSGAIAVEVKPSGLIPIGNNKLKCEYYHIKYGKGLWIINEKDFSILEELPGKSISDLSDDLLNKEPEHKGMVINRIRDNTGNYLLQWETLPVNQDRPRNPPYPAPTLLEVIKLSEK